MSYQVVYVPTNNNSISTRGAGFRLIMLTGAFLLILGFLTVKCWPQGREVLEKLEEGRGRMLPQASLETLANEIRWGTPVGEAVTAFCRDVISQGSGIGK